MICQPQIKQEASMKKIIKQIRSDELFVGIDLYKRRWHVTIRVVDAQIFSSRIAGRWEKL
jgi:hypothetical protein